MKASPTLTTTARHRCEPRHRLDAGQVMESGKNLGDQIDVRLSVANLAGLAVATEEGVRRGRRPFLAIRALSTLAISVILLGLWCLAGNVHTRSRFSPG